MKKIWKAGQWAVALLACFLIGGNGAYAAGEDTIKNGVYADGIDLSGMTEEEAKAAVKAYVDDLSHVEITLDAAGGNEVKVTCADLGMYWKNPQIVEEAMELGKGGNVIERYKALKDLEHDNHIYDVELGYSVEAIDQVLLQQCVKFDQKAKNYSLQRVNGAFQVTEGQAGYSLDVESSIDAIYNYMIGQWDHNPATIALNVAVEEPLGGDGSLNEVHDLLATFTTSYKSSSKDRSANVENGCRLINGITLYPGEVFSTYNTVSPFTEKNGYYLAGSYLNGKVVDSFGGGICQVSTTLYNAVLRAELQVKERHNHSMVVNYVDKSADAAIAESSGKDFQFVNSSDYQIYIEGITQNKTITFNIYGKETRPAGHEVSFESEVLETINPTYDQIYADSSHGIGYITTSSAHIGYKAKLWKIVKENGEEVSREVVNSSNYKMSPRSATVGVATADPNAHNEIMAAIGTASIDHVKAVIAILTAPPAPAEGAQ